MTVRPFAPTVSSQARLQATNHRLPNWARVWCWALASTNDYGHARAYPGELRQLLGDVNAREVSRAIRLARDRGALDACSTASCLVLPGHALAPCDAHHREAVA